MAFDITSLRFDLPSVTFSGSLLAVGVVLPHTKICLDHRRPTSIMYECRDAVDRLNF